MANKYQFLEHEEWAKGQLRKYIASNNKGLEHSRSFSDVNCKRLYTLAFYICPRLKGLIRWNWISFLKSDPTLSSKEVLDFAENLDDTYLQAHVYYIELLRMKGGRPQHKSFAPMVHENNFTPTQNLRLYRGFWSLSQFWAGIRIPKIKEGTTKDHRDNCVKYWTRMWEQGTNRTSDGSVVGSAQAAIFDPLGALDRLSNSPPTPSTSREADLKSCGCRFQKQAGKLRKKLCMHLAEHFLGPPSEMRDSSVDTDSSMG